MTRSRVLLESRFCVTRTSRLVTRLQVGVHIALWKQRTLLLITAAAAAHDITDGKSDEQITGEQIVPRGTILLLAVLFSSWRCVSLRDRRDLPVLGETGQ